MRPIRCFTCGKLLGDKFEEFDKQVKEGRDPKEVLDNLGLTRYCCRTVMLTSIDATDEIAKFKR